MSDLTDALRLAEALCARVCHDLSGSLGTLGGMLELMHDDGVDRHEAQALASEAALSLQQRLRFIRAAWASSSGPLSIQETRSLAAGMPGAERITLDLDALQQDVPLEAATGRALLGMLSMAAESLPSGGRIAVLGSERDMIFVLNGSKAAWPAQLADCLRDDDAILAAISQPRGLSMPLAILLARNAGLVLSFVLPSGAALAGPPPLRMQAG